MINLSEKETERLRTLYWKLQEAQGEFTNALNEIALAHALQINSEKWIVTPDFKRFIKG